MKVVHVLTNFFPQSTGGTEHYVFALCKGLFSLGIDSVIALPGLDDEHDRQVFDLPVFYFNEQLSEKAHSYGADLVHFHEVASGGKITSLHFKQVRNSGMRIVVSPHVCGNTCFTGSMYKDDTHLCDGIMGRWKCTSCFHQTKRPGLSTIGLTLASEMVYQLGVEIKKRNGRLATVLNNARQIEQHHHEFRTIVNLSDAVVGISNWYTDVLKRNFPNAENIWHIPTGEMQHSIMDVKVTHQKQLSLVFVGRITPAKGLHLLLDALSNFSNSQYTLKIIGGVQMCDQAYASRLKATYCSNENIEWLGVLNKEQTMQIVAASALLCLPSIVSEMSPLVIDEAHSVGVLVLASDVPGSKEKINEGENGYLFRRGDIQNLKAYLKMIFELGIQEKKKVIPVSSKPFYDTVQSYAELYRHILNENIDHC